MLKTRLGLLKKVATNKGKNKAVEFETMLRRHLLRGGAPVSPCAGFDSDTASSYLEGALWKPSRAHYETHLAGCPSCRQNLIGLARLSQSVVVRDTPTSPVFGESKYWGFWKSTVSSWRWNLNSQKAIIRNCARQVRDLFAWSTLAACSVLIALLVFQLWQREQPGSPKATLQSSKSLEYSDSAATPSPSLLASSQEGQGQMTEREKLVQKQESQPVQRSREPVPPDRDHELLGQIIGGDPNKNESPNKFDADLQKLSKLREGSVQAPLASSQQNFTNLSGPNSQSGQLITLYDGTERNAGRLKVQDKESRERAGAKAAQETADKAAEKPAEKRADNSDILYSENLRNNQLADDNPLQSRKTPRARDKSLASSAPTAKTSWIGRVMQKGLAPNQKADADEKSPEGKAENQETEKLLITNVRHKTFKFRRDGFWVDTEYNPGRDMYRVTHIKRGTKDFETLLSKEPQLKDFFDDLGIIIIVWRDEIYGVSQP